MGGVIFKCNSQNLATIAWAYAIQGIYIPQLMESFASKAVDIITTFSAQAHAPPPFPSVVSRTCWCVSMRSRERIPPRQPSFPPCAPVAIPPASSCTPPCHVV